MQDYRRTAEHHYSLGMHGGWTQGAPWTKRILVILIVAWLLALLAMTKITSWALSFEAMYLTPASVADGSFWQIFTAPVFGSLCVSQFIFHVLYLLVFGPKVERELGPSKFLRFYLIVAITATLAACVLRFFMAPLAEIPASTAAAPIFAVMVSYAVLWPRDPFWIFGLFPARIIYIVIFLCAVEILFAIIGGASPFCVDYIGSFMGIALGWTTMKIPSVRSLIIGSPKKAAVSPGARISKSEIPSTPRRMPDGPIEKKSDRPAAPESKPAPSKKGGRSKFLEF